MGPAPQAQRATDNQTADKQTGDDNPLAIRRHSLPPVAGAPLATAPAGVAPVNRADAGGASGLWSRMSFTDFRDRVLKIGVGSGSPALNDLFVDALLNDDRFADEVAEETRELLKLVVLYRMGRIKDMLRHMERSQTAARSLTGRVFHARALLADGDHKRACAIASRLPVGDPELPPGILSEALRMTALCAAEKKDMNTAGLMVDLARDRGIRAPIFYTVMDYLISGVKPRMKMPEKLGLIDYFFLRLTTGKPPHGVLEIAEPALVHALAHDDATSIELRIDAADQAARGGRLNGVDLTQVYLRAAKDIRRNKPRERTDDVTRVLLFDALARSRNTLHQAKIIDTLLKNARTEGLSRAMGQALLPYVQKMPISRELDWFAPRAVEAALIGGDARLTERWLLFVKTAGRRAYPAAEWLPLLELAQPGLAPRQDGFAMAMRLAKGKRIRGLALHRLASTLDAMSINVPIPLWNAAGKYPQPNKGALPAKGVLSKLKKAVDRVSGKAANSGGGGEVLLLAMQAVRGHPAHEMHLLAIGDITRALYKSGFRLEAGQFAFEALYGVWPTGKRRFSK